FPSCLRAESTDNKRGGGERRACRIRLYPVTRLLDYQIYFPTRCSTSLLFSWQMYSISSPLRSVGFVVNVHVRENIFGSSMMCTISMWPRSVRVMRSVTFMSFECGMPAASIHVMSFWPTVSTTRVSPSQWPIESPSHV